MKKKKPPIIAISVLVVLLAVPVIMSYRPDPKEEAHIDKPLAKSDSKSDIADSQKALLKNKMRPGHPGMPANSGRPSIEIMKVNGDPQKPSDASIIGQWYSDESVSHKENGIRVTAPPR